MGELDLRMLLEEVRRGRLSRRRFVQMIVGLGLTAPMAAQMLVSAGLAQAQTKGTVHPPKRGGGGLPQTLRWRAAHREARLQLADAVLVGCVLRPDRDDHSQAPLPGLQG